jgi:PTH2 family peptidyl-tRNA hydrolase
MILNYPRVASQAAHAAVEAAFKSDEKKVSIWRNNGQKKVVLKIDSEKALHQLNQNAKDSGFKTALISDAGRTVVEAGTITALAIGPDDETKIDLLTKNLKLL